jgi:hypothetical protein
MGAPFVYDDEYSVEEISYEDLMAVMSTQKSQQNKAEENSAQQDYPTAIENNAEKPNKNNQLDNDLAERLAKNANQTLPDWLLNN